MVHLLSLTHRMSTPGSFLGGFPLDPGLPNITFPAQTRGTACSSFPPRRSPTPCWRKHMAGKNRNIFAKTGVLVCLIADASSSYTTKSGTWSKRQPSFALATPATLKHAYLHTVLCVSPQDDISCSYTNTHIMLILFVEIDTVVQTKFKNHQTPPPPFYYALYSSEKPIIQ